MIIFQNKGLIDIAAVTTLGVSVKGDGAIGYFGTGLKFAIATILRHGGDVVINRGLEAFTFNAEPIEVRGQSFDRVCMNGEPLGFTTELGRDWEPWMAFRELASNCKDEGGEHFLSDSKDWEPQSDVTTITVSGEAMLGVWPERGSIMLEGDPIAENQYVEIRKGESPHVFYRGVRIFTPLKPTSQTYNILRKIELTEDRTAKSWWDVENQIEKGIGHIDDKQLLRAILTCGDAYSEHYMDVPRFGLPQSSFREVSREISLGSATVKNANPKAVQAARATAVDDMIADGGRGAAIQLSESNSKMIARAKKMLESVGFSVSDFPVIVCSTLGAGIHGMAKDGHIFLSLLPFEKGTREVAATLLEEYAHLKSGAGDCTRDFQNWLFDQILCQAEKSAGEPF